MTAARLNRILSGTLCRLGLDYRTLKGDSKEVRLEMPSMNYSAMPEY